MRSNMKRMMSSVIAVVFFVGLITLGQVFRGGEQDGGAGITPKALAKEMGGAKSVAGKCSEATVNGVYAFALTGSVIGVGPISTSGTTTFDGAGGVSITGIVNTTTLSPVLEGTFSGTYVVNPNDCTATAAINCPAPGAFGYTTLHFKAVIIDKGAEVRYLITDPGIVFAGATVKQ